MIVSQQICDGEIKKMCKISDCEIPITLEAGLKVSCLNPTQKILLEGQIVSSSMTIIKNFLSKIHKNSQGN